MKQLKRIAVAALAAAALVTTLGAGSASATTIEVEGTKKNSAVNLRYRIDLGASTILKDTFGFSVNTCTESKLRGFTSLPYTGATVTVPLWAVESFNNCTSSVTVHQMGTLHISHIAGTTNGTVSSSGAEITTDSPFGVINCKTGSGTHLGTLTGNAGGFSVFSTIHVNAVLSCSGISSRWTGTYASTWNDGIGVSA